MEAVNQFSSPHQRKVSVLLGLDAPCVAFPIFGTLLSCIKVVSFRIRIAAISISVETLFVGVAALEVPVEETYLVYLLWTTAIGIWPRVPSTWRAIRFHRKSSCDSKAQTC